MVDKAMDDCISGKELPKDPSALQSLIQYYYERDFKRDAKKLRICRGRIANDMFFFSMAAFSNSFSAAGWALYHVLMDTNGIGKKVREEFEEMEKLNQQVVSSSNNAEEIEHDVNKDLHKKYSFLGPQSLQNCILEVTRLYTPGNNLRTVKKPVTLPVSGATIPAGVTIVFSSFHALRHGWDDALSFRPDRFGDKENVAPGKTTAKPNGKTTAKPTGDDGDDNNDEKKGTVSTTITKETNMKNDFNFIGFGMGSHPCVGKQFAMLEISAFVQECLNFGFTIAKTNHDDDDEDEDDEFMKHVIQTSSTPHPKLLENQSGFIWRPKSPIYLEF